MFCSDSQFLLSSQLLRITLQMLLRLQVTLHHTWLYTNLLLTSTTEKLIVRSIEVFTRILFHSLSWGEGYAVTHTNRESLAQWLWLKAINSFIIHVWVVKMCKLIHTVFEHSLYNVTFSFSDTTAMGDLYLQGNITSPLTPISRVPNASNTHVLVPFKVWLPMV